MPSYTRRLSDGTPNKQFMTSLDQRNGP